MTFLSLLRQDVVLLCQLLEPCLSPGSLHTPYGDRQREMRWSSLGKDTLEHLSILQEDLSLKKRESNFLQMQIVIGQGGTVLN